MTAPNEGSERRYGPPIGAILGTVLGVAAWLVFIILYTVVWSKSYSLFQNLIVTVASFLIAALLIAAMWIIWIFRTGRSRFWWNNEDRRMAHNHGGNKEFLNLSQRCGQVFAVVVILLIFAFFWYNQITNTGFFTSNFGQLEILALYGSILLSIIPPLARAVIGARNPARPLEAVSNVFSIFACLFLLTVFPFNFAHFTVALPPTVRFAFSWITNDFAKLALMLIILGCMVSAFFNVVKFMTLSFHWNMSNVGTGKSPPY